MRGRIGFVARECLIFGMGYYRSNQTYSIQQLIKNRSKMLNDNISSLLNHSFDVLAYDIIFLADLSIYLR